MEDQKPEDTGLFKRPTMAEISDEMLGAANNLKGPDFANYAASLVEMAQLRDCIRRLATPELREGREMELLAMSTHLCHSIDSKISPELSLEERMEAGVLAGHIMQRAAKEREEATRGGT